MPDRPKQHRAARGGFKKHQPKPRPREPENRGSARERGYTTIWDKLSKRMKRERPLCEWCLRLDKYVATEIIDHIIPVHIAPELRLTEKNLQALCRTCHGIKTRRDNREYGGVGRKSQRL